MPRHLPHDLGPLTSHIAGPPFYRSSASPGEEVYLGREPDNAHDSNAFRLENLDFEPIGHLPRRLASWLAVALGAASMAACAAAMLLLRRHLASIFIDNADVRATSSTALTFVILGVCHSLEDYSKTALTSHSNTRQSQTRRPNNKESGTFTVWAQQSLIVEQKHCCARNRCFKSDATCN